MWYFELHLVVRFRLSLLLIQIDNSSPFQQKIKRHCNPYRRCSVDKIIQFCRCFIKLIFRFLKAEFPLSNPFYSLKKYNTQFLQDNSYHRRQTSIKSVYTSVYIVPLNMKRCICHLVKKQMHPFIFKGTIYAICLYP